MNRNQSRQYSNNSICDDGRKFRIYHNCKATPDVFDNPKDAREWASEVYGFNYSIEPVWPHKENEQNV